MSPSTQLLSLLILGYSAIGVSFALGVLCLVRYRKTKNKRQLRRGILLLLGGPALIFIMVYGGCSWVLYEVDKGTIIEPDFFQKTTPGPYQTN